MEKLTSVLLLTLLLVSVFSPTPLAQTYPSFGLKWRYHITTGVDGIAALDLDGDGSKEIYASSCDDETCKIFVFNGDGELMWSSSMPHYLQPSYPTANEKTKEVYFSDLEDDGVLDMLVTAELIGSGINTHPLYGIRREVEPGLDRTYNRLKWERRELGYVRGIYTADITDDGIKEIITGSDNLNVYCLDKNGSVLWEQDVEGSVYSVYATDMKGGKDDEFEVIAGTFEELFVMNVTPRGPEIMWRYKLWERIQSIYVVDLNSDGAREIIVGTQSGEIYAFSEETHDVLWTYSAPSLRGDIISGDFDGNGEEELFFLKSREVIGLDGSGKKVTSYTFDASTESIYTNNVDDDEHMELIIGTSKDIYVFDIGEYQAKKFEADEYMSKAEAYFNSGDCGNAVDFAKEAGYIYLEIDDDGGIQDVKALISKCDSSVSVQEKRDTASEYYETAKNYFKLNDYEQAIFYGEEALSIYKDIYDDDGIAHVQKFLSEVREAMKFIVVEEADGLMDTAQELYYNDSFDNASETAKAARELYQSVGYNEGISAADELITGIEEAKAKKETMDVADNYYNASLVNYENGELSEAMTLAVKARDLYSDISHSEGTLRASKLITEIGNMRMNLEKAERANSYYAKALEYYNEGNSEEAMSFAERARNTYAEINDHEGIANADKLMSRIEGGGSIFGTYAILGIVVIAIIGIYIFMKRRGEASTESTGTPIDLITHTAAQRPDEKVKVTQKVVGVKVPEKKKEDEEQVAEEEATEKPRPESVTADSLKAQLAAIRAEKKKSDWISDEIKDKGEKSKNPEPLSQEEFLRKRREKEQPEAKQNGWKGPEIKGSPKAGNSKNGSKDAEDNEERGFVKSVGGLVSEVDKKDDKAEKKEADEKDVKREKGFLSGILFEDAEEEKEGDKKKSKEYDGYMFAEKKKEKMEKDKEEKYEGYLFGGGENENEEETQ